MQLALCTPSQIEGLISTSTNDLCSTLADIQCAFVGRMWNDAEQNDTQTSWLLDTSILSPINLRLVSLSCAESDVSMQYTYHFVNPGGEELGSQEIPLKYLYSTFAGLWSLALLFMAVDGWRYRARMRQSNATGIPDADWARPTWRILLQCVLLTFAYNFSASMYYISLSLRGVYSWPSALALLVLKLGGTAAEAALLLTVGKGLGFSRNILHKPERDVIAMTLFTVVAGSLVWSILPGILSFLMVTFVWWGVGRIVYKTSRSTQRFTLILGMTRQNLAAGSAARDAASNQPPAMGDNGSAQLRRPGGQAQTDVTATTAAAARRAAGQAASMRPVAAANFGTASILQLRQARFYWMFTGMAILLVTNALFSAIWASQNTFGSGEIWSSIMITSTIQYVVFVRLIQMMRLNSPYDLYYNSQQYNLLLILAPLMGPEAQWRNTVQSTALDLGTSQPSEPREAPATFLQQIARAWRAAEFAPDGDAGTERLAGDCAPGSNGLPEGTIAARRRVLVVHPDKSESLGTVAVVSVVAAVDSTERTGSPAAAPTATGQLADSPAAIADQTEEAEAGAVPITGRQSRGGYQRL